MKIEEFVAGRPLKYERPVFNKKGKQTGARRCTAVYDASKSTIALTVDGKKSGVARLTRGERGARQVFRHLAGLEVVR